MSTTESSFSQEKLPYNDLTKAESYVIRNKGTEAPYKGKYTDFTGKGTYLCRQCGEALYYSSDKFKSDCGWPSFDDAIKGAVLSFPDPDGIRTEIECANCGAHLGHVFIGEHLTSKDVRYCVNSVSMDFVPAHLPPGRYGTAIFAGGGFRGMQYFMQKAPGVVCTIAGYIGGHVRNPDYSEVSKGTTGYAEAVKVIYDPARTTYDKLLRLFLEVHDPTEAGHRGPDYGDEYRSEIFYKNQEQRETAEKDLNVLRSKGLKITTKLTEATEFYPAEEDNQNYYIKNGKLPEYHVYTKRF